MEMETQMTQSTYDPRWFIWTIVFLVTTGVMLVTYITTSATDDTSAPIVTATKHNKVLKK